MLESNLTRLVIRIRENVEVAEKHRSNKIQDEEQHDDRRTPIETRVIVVTGLRDKRTHAAHESF